MGVEDLVPGCGHISYFVKMHYFFFSTAIMVRQIKQIVMMSKEGSTKILTLMTPRTVIFVLGLGNTIHVVQNALFLCICCLFYPWALIKQTKITVMMSQELRFYQCCKFHDPWYRHFQIGLIHVVKMCFSLKDFFFLPRHI